ncbi:MAG TPA: hypothetical protein VLN08_11725 [Vicinamibacterales bacterium]|nr:hypothetical protein [Vicinamibacterales bacterium]
MEATPSPGLKPRGYIWIDIWIDIGIGIGIGIGIEHAPTRATTPTRDLS